ncbi:MAG: septum formation initiator family protein [Clostridia bacterium]|nr:septum formation initiator family protein [Clostridia bacterium]MBR6005460.1 septum formation initiator family protein [Clostridia bacterium]
MRKPKLENKKIPIVLVILLLALVIYFVVSLVTTKSKLNAVEREKASLSEQISRQEEENERLKETISNEDKDDYIERIARDEYDYAGENERVYYASDAE